jgi:hypothetical protein
MATSRIPNSSGQIRQLNLGSLYGEVSATRNIDLTSNPGKIKQSYPVKKIMDNDDYEESREFVQAIRVLDGDLVVLTDDVLYKGAVDGTPPSSTLVDDFPGMQDVVLYDGQYRISTNNDIGRWSGSSSLSNDWWTEDTNGPQLSGSGADIVPHVMEVLRLRGRDILSVTDGNRIRYYNSGFNTPHNTVSWDEYLTATCQAQSLRGGWVGTMNEKGTGAEVFFWRPGVIDSETGEPVYDQAYPADCDAVLSMYTHYGIPFIIDEQGQLKRFNNAGFEVVGRLPFSLRPLFLDGVRAGNIQAQNISRPIHPKGLTRQGNTFYAYIQTEEENTPAQGRDTLGPDMPAGVWAFEPATGSSHHFMSAPTLSTTRSSPLLVTNHPEGRFLFATDDGSEATVWQEDLTATSQYSTITFTEDLSDSFIDNISSVSIAAQLKGDERIVVKWRGSQVATPLFVTLNWVNETTCTTTDNLTGVKEGDEIDIVSGQAASRVAHITAIEGTNTKTLTIDEAIGSTGATSKAWIDHWIKKGVVTSNKPVTEIPINEMDTKSQIKLYMEGLITIDRVVTKTTNKQPLK